VPAGSSIFLRTQLSAQTGRSYAVIGAGDHTGTVDFLGTATLLGFAAFADAETTQPLPDVVITSEGGFTYETIQVPEPAAAWLVVLGLVVGGAVVWGRRPSNPVR
jgi:hypothetical protein